MSHRGSRCVWLAGSVSCLLAAAGSTEAQHILYVDQDATGPVHDGSTWCEAYAELYEALAVATSGDTILVGESVYLPDTTELQNPRQATFQLANGITIEGGYAGCGAPDPDERDIVVYETVLSCDLDSNDIGGLDDPSRDENCYQVVIGSDTDETAVLDGFTITGGNADGPQPGDSGGGMYNNSGSPTLNACTFGRNTATYWGGGMFNDDHSSPTLNTCTFSKNTASIMGGGMFNDDYSSPTLTDCNFVGNSAHWGGGMRNTSHSSPTLTDCTFSDNSADDWGGGMYNYSSSAPTLTGCAFSGCSADRGGGMYNGDANSNASLTNCIFMGNHADDDGGGLWTAASGPPLTNCLFIGNSADVDGGGIYNYSGDPTLTGCTFSGNTAGDVGGGLRASGSDATLTNCIFIGNSAVDAGGGMSGDFGSAILSNCTFAGNVAYYGGGINAQYGHPVLTNCILWGNSDAGGEDESGQIHEGAPVVNYCCIQGWTGDLGGNGNIGDDPLFVPGPAGCYYLSQTAAGGTVDSPCVDAGSDTAANLGLDALTTRSDEGGDTSMVDMGYHYYVTGQPLIMGDFDRDGRVDLADYAELLQCFTGGEPTGVSPCCRIFDIEPDGDVDLADYASFRLALTGPQARGW